MAALLMTVRWHPAARPEPGERYVRQTDTNSRRRADKAAEKGHLFCIRPPGDGGAFRLPQMAARHRCARARHGRPDGVVVLLVSPTDVVEGRRSPPPRQFGRLVLHSTRFTGLRPPRPGRRRIM